jgi:hypothetical protein
MVAEMVVEWRDNAKVCVAEELACESRVEDDAGGARLKRMEPARQAKSTERAFFVSGSGD